MATTRSNIRHIVVLTGMSMITMYVVFSSSLILLPSRHDTHDPRAKSAGECDDMFHFVPGRNQSLKDCDGLFFGTPAAGFEMSEEYMAKNDAFHREVERVWDTRPEVLEGHSYQLPTMFKAMHYIASRPTIKHICETGFNMGHSSFNFLTASKETIVHSFDLGNHGYAHNMADYLNRTFGERFSLWFGDSTKTVCIIAVVSACLNHTMRINLLLRFSLLGKNFLGVCVGSVDG